MNTKELEGRLSEINDADFVSNQHRFQHRAFGFVTANIRSADSFLKYIADLVPEYLERKHNYPDWEKWFSDPVISKREKQKFQRMEVAKILFRRVNEAPTLNDAGEELYGILQKEGEPYLKLILFLYLLSGRYFGVDNQPMVECEKILAQYRGDFCADAKAFLSATNDVRKDISGKCGGKKLEVGANRLLLAMAYYNPSCEAAYEIACDLLENEPSEKQISLLWEKLYACKRLYNAGGYLNYIRDVLFIFNYLLFKEACLRCAAITEGESAALKLYAGAVFDNGLNKLFGLKGEAAALESVLMEHKRLISDVMYFIWGEKKQSGGGAQQRKNIKQKAIEKYGHVCFFDYFAEDKEIKKLHAATYFKTKTDGENYLEGHHMVQMQNGKFFKNDVDIVENIIPVCPNCHRKLHHGDDKTVSEMLEFYGQHWDKKALIRNGIFVDIETLKNFYGIEGD